MLESGGTEKVSFTAVFGQKGPKLSGRLSGGKEAPKESQVWPVEGHILKGDGATFGTLRGFVWKRRWCQTKQFKLDRLGVRQ